MSKLTQATKQGSATRRTAGESTDDSGRRIRCSVEIGADLHTELKIIAAHRQTNLREIFATLAAALADGDERAEAILNERI